MDQIERLLLNVIQKDFPVGKRPYRILGEIVRTTENEAWERIQKLRNEGIIRRIGGVFNSQRLGYFSTLCAAKVPENKIPCLTDLLEQIPGVTHNYLRAHAYNVWFTLIAPSRTKGEAILADLRKQSGVFEIYSQPTIRVFKINVEFDFAEQGLNEQKDCDASLLPTSLNADKILGFVESPKLEPVKNLTSKEKELIKLLQDDLPGGFNPYAKLAEILTLTEDDVLELISSLKYNDIIRRFGAVIRHQKAGFTANLMSVWQVPEERIIDVGLIMAGFKEITHCYQRQSLPDWTYNLFSMTHGRSMEQCMDVIDKVARATGLENYETLYSTAELKKTSMKYF